MIINLTGNITEISPLEVVNEKLEKVKVTLEVNEYGSEKIYTNYYLLEFLNKDIALLTDKNVGDEVTVSADFRGKKTAMGKVFMTLKVFKLK